MAFISSCLSVSFFTSISSYETKEPSLADSYEILHDNSKIRLALIVKSKLICCRFAFAELFDWFNEVVQRALANQNRKTKLLCFNQSGTKTPFSVFPGLATIVWYHARVAKRGKTCDRCRLHDFPRLTPVACFPALVTGCMLSHAWYLMHVLPRLATIVQFPALDTGGLFSHAWHRLHFWRVLIEWLRFSVCCDWSGVIRQSFKSEK